jgi:hypothetical protein
LLGLTGIFCLHSAPLQIDNRDPRPGELGYRPVHEGEVRLNPPSFIWLHESEAVTYEIEWSSDKGFRGASTATGLPFNTYTHDDVWAPGTYHWRYRFRDASGRLSGWSRVRTVMVPENAVAFPMPTRAQQRERVPKGHPRLFMRPEDLPRLRSLALGAARDQFEPLVREADRLLRSEPTPEPEHRGSARNKTDLEAIRYWWPNRQQTQKACQEAETLAFVYLLTGEARYGKAARRWILHLASWDPDGPTNFRLNCEAAKPLLYRLPRAYDWAYAALSESDRGAVQRAMARRATDAWKNWEIKEGVGHFNSPYGSHANRIWHKLGECALAFLGEIPEADTWLDYAVNKFHACYPVWSDDNGGWHEGVSYWGGYMSKAVWWLQVARAALEIDGFKKPFFAQVVDYPMYVAPPGSPNMGFGDLAHRPVPSSWGGFIDFFTRMSAASSPDSNAPYWRWWAGQWEMRPQSGILGFLYTAGLPPSPPARPPTDLPLSKVFSGIGVASLHTSLIHSRDDVHFLFKSSPFGTQSHGHNPHNSFQLNVYGEPLLTTCVYRDLHGSPFHYRWAHSTVAHNAVLVDGEGQIQHTAAPHGRIMDHQLTKDWDYVVGDATAAYGPRLERYHRHVVFLRPNLVVLWDDLQAHRPSTFQFMLHALNPFSIDGDDGRLEVEHGEAAVEIRYLSDTPLEFRQWDGYDPEPRREFPNQWHVEASTVSKSRHASTLTVLLPRRTSESGRWTVKELSSATAVGIVAKQGGRTRQVAFRRAHIEGPARIGDWVVEGPVGVR